MKLLIDTHVFLWLLYAPEKIDTKQMQALNNLDNTLYLSSMSIAEIMIKRSLGKLNVDFKNPNELINILEHMGIKLLDYDGLSALHLGSLPFHHRDPFDRMIITQAIEYNYTIVTVDAKFKMYPCKLL